MPNSLVNRTAVRYLHRNTEFRPTRSWSLYVKIKASHLAIWLLPIIGAIGLAAPAIATSGVTSGYIKNTYLPSTYNGMDYRITVADASGNASTICPGQTFAYANQSDLNYVYIAKTITMMRGLQISESFYWTTDASGYCHITSVNAQPTSYYNRAPISGTSSTTQTILGFIGVLFRFF